MARAFHKPTGKYVTSIHTPAIEGDTDWVVNPKIADGTDPRQPCRWDSDAKQVVALTADELAAEKAQRDTTAAAAETARVAAVLKDAAVATDATFGALLDKLRAMPAKDAAKVLRTLIGGALCVLLLCCVGCSTTVEVDHCIVVIYTDAEVPLTP